MFYKSQYVSHQIELLTGFFWNCREKLTLVNIGNNYSVHAKYQQRTRHFQCKPLFYSFKEVSGTEKGAHDRQLSFGIKVSKKILVNLIQVYPFYRVKDHYKPCQLSYLFKI